MNTYGCVPIKLYENWCLNFISFHMSQYTFSGFYFNHLKMQKLLSAEGFTEKGKKSCWQEVKMLTSKPNHVDSIPRPHMVEENWSLQTVLRLSNAYYGMCTQTHTDKHIDRQTDRHPLIPSLNVIPLRKEIIKACNFSPGFCYVPT